MGIFSTQNTSRPNLAPAHPPHNWLPGFFHGVKQPKHDAVHSHPSHAEVETLLCLYSPFVFSYNVWNDFTCMEPTHSLLGSQEPATCLYPEPYESSLPSYLSSLRFVLLTLQRGVTGTARMLHALTHSSISRQVREQM